ncbi:hypothetical protein ACFQJ5_03005 [Halomicroarcula sp. GCM10025324]|uniref:hypothetical protein n=1 Tax=Haloarcula TaxID=2237 RepID=UPI0023E84525|nr:hypothetical protein [Halomicroarcula sp. ZS-22-S1]
MSDGDSGPSRAVANFRRSARQFWRSLAARPVWSGAAFAVFALGEVGGRFLTGLELLSGVLIVVGGLALVYLGSLDMD